MEKDYITKLNEHLEAREWSDEQRLGLYAILGKNIVRSAETTLDILEYQQGEDKKVADSNEKQRWAIAERMIPQSFFEDAEDYRQPWDVT